MITVSDFDDSGQAFFSDLFLGAEEYYEIDCSTYLTAENDTLTNVTWTVPDGLTSLDEQNTSTTASIKLRADIVGTFFVGFTLDSTESSNTQKTKELIKIEVLDFG